MAFTFGIYFGLIYLKTNNLIACIIMHTLFDFLVALISLFEAKDVDGNTLFSILFPAIVLVVEASGELTISYFVLKKTN
jgi:membrane protease YdiL (CAAX protease family)